MKKLFLFGFFSLLLIFFLYFIYISYAFIFFAKDHQILKLSFKENFFSQEEREIVVEVVNSRESTKQGLSNRQDFLSNQGQKIDALLFVFPEEETRSFWMKDMLFEIDICWLQNLALTSCQKARPSSSSDEQLEIYHSPFITNLVLETEPDFFTKNDSGKKFFFKWW